MMSDSELTAHPKIRENRWTYQGPIEAAPELVLFGKDDLLKAIPLGEHAHPGCFEFVFVERGKARWEMGGVLYETQAGDVFHTRPDEIHSGGFKVIEPCKFWWLIVKKPHPDGWLRLSAEEIREVEQALYDMPRVIHTGMQPDDACRNLRRVLTDRGAFRSIEIRQAILQLLLLFVLPQSANRPIADDLLGQFDMLIERMRTEPDWRPSIKELAQTVKVSPSHFHRMFQSYTGLSPMSYVERLRNQEACRRLTESTDSITEIAHALGYATSQHFATVFKRFMGVTPTQWRGRYSPSVT